MEQIIVNKDCIQEKEITEIVKRVKAIIINSKNEILLGYSHNDYQFLGGHVENGENLIESLKREIGEESPYTFYDGILTFSKYGLTKEYYFNNENNRV